MPETESPEIHTGPDSELGIAGAGTASRCEELNHRDGGDSLSYLPDARRSSDPEPRCYHQTETTCER